MLTSRPRRIPFSLKYNMPEVVATQLWLAPLLGTLCGTSAKAIPERANINAVVNIAVAHTLAQILPVMSLLVALRAWNPQLTCREGEAHHPRCSGGRYRGGGQEVESFFLAVVPSPRT